ncbi:MAG: tRNA epoxyqueuosine(34) reductase QueG [Chitinophagales bacterium]|nr:tRNA epoxyqueuosine(34) reductase QueG [Chitinophagales bacterium]
MNRSKSELTNLIKQKAYDMGFMLCGISKAEFMDQEAQRLEAWLNQGYNGEMAYLNNYFDLRTDPTKLVPDSKSVISLAYNYYNDSETLNQTEPKISMYAYGRDYHKVIRNKLKALFEYIQSIAGDVQGRVFVDSAPVLEKSWASRSGLGWIGKHSMLISPKKGSHFFLGEIILDLELHYDGPMKDFCGTCTRCIEACPTEAISPKGYFIDGSKCISYLTIELRSAIPDEFADKMEGWAFGCDICQQVCPWNRFSTPHQEPDFYPKPDLTNLSKDSWQDITEEQFDKVFMGSPVKRTKYEGLKRNIQFLKIKPKDQTSS